MKDKALEDKVEEKVEDTVVEVKVEDNVLEGNKVIVCGDCNAEFVFTKEDQEFFAAKGYADPKRCLTCRAKRRAERNQWRR